MAVEALVRWNHPTRGLLMPGAFIDLAEETGAVIPMGEWVLREACRQAAGWRDAYPAAENGLSVDDLGTGYVALSYLRSLPVSVLKIDRSFVDGIDTDPDAYAVAEAVVHLAQAYRLHVVAEGIETAEQARCLVEMGCGHGQGYHFARPMPGPALAELLDARSVVNTSAG